MKVSFQVEFMEGHNQRRRERFTLLLWEDFSWLPRIDFQKYQKEVEWLWFWFVYDGKFCKWLRKREKR